MSFDPVPFVGLGGKPSIVSAQALTSVLIQIVFDEPMKAATFIAENFTLTANGGATARTITEAAAQQLSSPTAVLLTTSGPMDTGAAKYTVLCLPDVQDAAGNAIDSDNDERTLDIPDTPSITDVSSAGGEVRSAAIALSDGDYYVDLGLDPYASSVRAYSGIAGRGNACALRDGVVSFVVPPLAPAIAYKALVTPVSGGGGILTAALLNVRRRPLFASTHSLRRVLPDRWDIGPTTPGDEEVA